MRNKLLSITRETIPYVKELRSVCGSVTACILMQQLDYWFNKNRGSFYKFLSPCPNHPKYKDGDSWVEELGFSEAEFRCAFEKIGVAHKSKKEFETSENPFKDKFYCSYHDKINGETYYFRNDELVDKILDSLSSVNQQSQSTEIKKVNLRKSTKSIYVNQQSQSTEIKKVNPELYTENFYTETTTETTTENMSNLKNSDFPHVEKADLNTGDNKEKSSAKKEIKNIAEITEIVEYLNQATQKQFKVSTTETQKFISGRITEGYTIQDLKDVIDYKVAEWGNNDKMKPYLQPSTLFNQSNFEKYYQTVIQLRTNQISINHGDASKSTERERLRAIGQQGVRDFIANRAKKYGVV